MAVDPNIKKKADDIRNKIYGREVRESLASGLEEMSKDVVENTGRQDNVENQFQDVIENTTDKDVISAPEIIAARDGEPNLKARLDKENQEVTAQLAQKANQEDLETANENIAHSHNLIASDIKNRMPAIFTKPEGFNFSKEVIVYRNEKGEYSSNIKAEDYIPDISDGTGTYYVDIQNGDNSNDGLTPQTALRDGSYAHTKFSPSEVVFMEGIYDRNSIGSPIQNNCIWRAMEGHDVILGRHEPHDSLTWASEGNGVYSTTRSSVALVWDGKYSDENDLFTKYEEVSSLQECINNHSAFYKDGSTLYVHTTDDREPDTDIFVSISVPFAAKDPALTGDVHHYLEGLKLYFGTSYVLTETGTNSKFIAKDCEFNYRSGSNGANIEGYALCIFEDCKANGNRLDGFNYHEFNGLNGEAIEINCDGLGNGFEDGSNNGSSAHESYKTVRVGGNYHSNKGENIADVNDTQSWIVGVKASNSTGYNRDFNINKGWLQSCYSTSEQSISIINPANNDQVAYIKDCVLFGEITGDVKNY